MKWIVKRLKGLDERYRANGTRFKPCSLMLRMAENGERFYADGPVVSFVERNVPPKPKL